MNKYFCEAIRTLLEQSEKCSLDQHGFLQCLHVSLLDNVRAEYEAHCRKHGNQLAYGTILDIDRPFPSGEGPRKNTCLSQEFCWERRTESLSDKGNGKPSVSNCRPFS